MKHFKFLKTIGGKGYFNLFLASMFLVGNGGSIFGYFMCGAFAILGLFFVSIGCASNSGYDNSDIKKDDIKAKAKGSYKSTGKDDNLIDKP